MRKNSALRIKTFASRFQVASSRGSSTGLAGLRIEVKSAAYMQSWSQKKLSPIQFVVRKSLGWHADTSETDADARRQADVYVFALLAHQGKATIDPLNLAQWQFWAVPTEDLDARTRSQHSVTLNSLRDLAGEPVELHGLAAAIRRAARRCEETCNTESAGLAVPDEELVPWCTERRGKCPGRAGPVPAPD